MSSRSWLGAGALALLLLAALLGAWLLLADGDAVGRLLRRDATWAQMQETRDFRVGLDPSFPPFEQLNADGVPEGYDVDLANALAARWGTVAKVNAIGFDSLLDALRASRIDAVISAMPYDERLTRDVAFSQAYFDAGVRLAVRSGSPVKTVEDLSGGRVAVEWGSAGDTVARRLLREQNLAFEVVPYDTPEEAVAAAASDTTIAALFVDQVSLRLAQGDGRPLVAVGPVLESNPYVIVTPRRAHILADEVAAALADFAADGTLSTIEERWFGAAPEAHSLTGK